MIAAGQRYSLTWKHSHRIEAVVVELREHEVMADCDHRCNPPCYLLRDHPSTLILSGRRMFSYRDFSNQFTPMAEDAIALTGA